jgi:hypothetical protein
MCPPCEASIAQVPPRYLKSKIKLNDQIIKITSVAAFKSALLARSSASVLVYPRCEALLAQVDPFYFECKRIQTKSKDVYFIRRMHVGFVFQKKSECLGVSMI